jgi:hypothetical protein
MLGRFKTANFSVGNTAIFTLLLMLLFFIL